MSRTNLKPRRETSENVNATLAAATLQAMSEVPVAAKRQRVIKTLTVDYETLKLTKGYELIAWTTEAIPHVAVGREKGTGSLFTVVMTSANEPVERLYDDCACTLHWVVTDIPGGSDTRQGREAVPFKYDGPQRRVQGGQRYFLMLFEQRSPITLRRASACNNFELRLFTRAHKLGYPVGSVEFHSQTIECAARTSTR